MTDPDREIWNGMLAHLREHHPALCRRWFADLTPVTVAEGSVYLRAEKEVHREYLRRACVDAFVDAAQSASNRLLGVRFLGPGEPAPEPARAPGRGAHEQAPSARDEGVAGPRGAETEIKPPLLRQGPLHKKRDGFPLGSSEAAAGGVGSFFLNPDYIFENFIVGEGNRWAYAAAVGRPRSPP